MGLKVLAGIGVGTPLTLLEGLYGAFKFEQTSRGEVLYRLSGGHIGTGAHADYLLIQQGMRNFFAHPGSSISSAVSDWFNDSMQKLDRHEYFSYGMNMASGSATVVTTLEGGVGLARTGVSLTNGAVRIAGSTMADVPLMGSMRAQTGAAGDLSQLSPLVANARPPIRVSREQALRDVLAEAEAKQVQIVTGREADEYLDHAARMEGIPAEAMHSTNLGPELVFVRDAYAGNPRVLREELIHTGQQADVRLGAGGLNNRPQLEMEARLEIIRNRHQWGITNEEVRQMIWEIRTIRRTGRY